MQNYAEKNNVGAEMEVSLYFGFFFVGCYKSIKR